MNKKQAIVKANKLLKKVKGKGWKASVWENLGWHYCLQGDFICLDPCNDNTYHAMLGDEKGGCAGLSDWTGDIHHKDPNLAIDYAIKNAEKKVRGINKCRKTCQGML